MTRSPLLALAAGAAAALGLRTLAVAALAHKLRGDLARLDAGDHRPLLAAYADDAVLSFNYGEHRWAGEHRGRPAIERFLREFAAAGLQGELVDVLVGGPPWALRIMTRFDDRAEGPNGEKLYRNRVMMSLQMRWGRIVRHEDFYEDTGRIERFDRRLTELGKPAARCGAGAG